MKSWNAFFIACIGCLAFWPRPVFCADEAAIPSSFSLQDCYVWASRRSETLGMRGEDVKAAEARYWQAVSGLLPKIHLKGTEKFFDENSSGSSQGNGLWGNHDSFESSINVKQPIFHGFREFAAARAASAEKEANRFSLQRARQLLYLDVADAFYQILSYENDLAVLGDLRQALQDRVQELERRVKIGRSRKSEVLLARTDLADVQVTIEQTKKLLLASRELMAFLMGVSAEKIRLDEKAIFPSAEKIEHYLAHTGERPDVLAQIQKLRSAKSQVSAYKADHWPTINAEGNYYPYTDPKNGGDWNIALTVDLPIFEGGLIEAKVKESQAMARSAEFSLSEAQRSAEKDVRTAYNNFIASGAEFVRLQELGKIAEENLAEQKKDYGRGVSSNLDVLDALQTFQNARRRVLDAEFTARNDWARLLVSAGIDAAVVKKPL